MAYNGLQELPSAIRARLPVHAQEIYRVAFNGAWGEYSDSRDREGGSREETAHKVAWVAVKGKYRKLDNNSWTLK